MSRVDALEGEGRLLDAVDTLRAADTFDDLDLASRQLHLRRRAFAELAKEASPLTWPPVLPDPFPDVRDTPELMPDELTTQSVGGSILHHGSVIVRRLATPQTVAALADGIERSFAAIDAWMAGGRSEDATSHWFKPFDAGGAQKPAMREWVRSGGGVWAVESPVVACRVLDLYHAIGLREILAGYFGEAPAVSVEKLTLRKVTPETIPSWHQDGAFMGAGVRSLNVWLALTDCGSDAPVPGLELVSHRVSKLLETGTEGAFFPTGIAHELVEQIAAPSAIVRPAFRAGDALFFDDRLVHRSAVSEGMTGARYAVESWFFAASTFPDTYQGMAF
jgi:hypothetical protein